MLGAFTVSIAVVVVASALRSTWSPCGWSMLSTITPMSERARQHRFGVTASWFVGGAVLGGAAIGAVGALGAWLVSLADLGTSTRLGLFAGVALLAGLLDWQVVGPRLPHHRRQVNELWLDEFRPWVYASGFGFQIGTGLATYIMTGGVYAVVAGAALTANPIAAVVVGTSFGLARGLAVLAGWKNRDGASLAMFHQRFAVADEPVRRAVAATLICVGATSGLVALGAPSEVAIVAVVFFVVVCVAALRSVLHSNSGDSVALVQLDRDLEPT